MKRTRAPSADKELPHYQIWLSSKFKEICYAPLSDRHHRLWSWFVGLKKDNFVPAQVEVWPRGGGKSSTVELACAYIGQTPLRQFVLYVCGTQDQADLHVQSIGSLFETLGVDRAVGKYGTPKGWRRDQLRASNGFNVAAIGLDVASRGVKLDQYRPDLIIFDDVDAESDSDEIVRKKIRAITSKIMPAGSTDCAILFIQNLIHENSIVSQLVDGRAGFLLDRVVPAVEPAVLGLVTSEVRGADGANRIKIVGGEPTWEGQDLATCEYQINKWGLSAFKREAQQEVKGASGFFFNEKRLEADPELPVFTRLVRAWDLAATEGGGDYTAGVLMGLTSAGVLYVLDVVRGQLETSRVRKLISDVARLDKEIWDSVTIVYPQDPGQAGKDQAGSFARMLFGFTCVCRPVTGKKQTRAKNWQERVNEGNAFLFMHPEYREFKEARGLCVEWFRPFREEHRLFRADEKHVHDDQVDAASDAANELLSETAYDRAVKQVLGMTINADEEKARF